MKKQCLQCGQEFSKPENCSLRVWETRKFCNEKCVSGWMKGKPARNKENVKNLLEGGEKHRFVKGQKFTEEFKAKMRGRTPWNKGKSVHLSPKTEFKQGIVPWNKGLGNCSEVIRIRNSPKYREWCKQLLAEADYTCKRCKIRGGRMQIHHKEMVCIAPERIMDKTNVEVICYQCHRHIHKYEQSISQYLKAKYRATKTLGHEGSRGRA